MTLLLEFSDTMPELSGDGKRSSRCLNFKGKSREFSDYIGQQERIDTIQGEPYLL
jgi:hypothetical protein